jgi:hypothetical protein
MVTGRPRVAVLSRRLLQSKVWHASQYEFEDVVADVADVRLVTPTPLSAGPARTLGHRVLNRARTAVRAPARELARSTQPPVEADVFFAVFAAPHEIGLLPSAREQMRRAATRVAFIVEVYEPGMPAARHFLRQLRGFDHVFVFTRAVLPEIEALTDVPTTYLPTGVDALRFAPPSWRSLRDRPVDVMSYGRRLESPHSVLVSAMSEGRVDYVFDSDRSPVELTSHEQHRLSLASALQRSRYSVVFRINDEPSRIQKTGGEETLTNRYFETTAAGAVLLGSRPSTPDFDDCFPWRDAIVPIAQDGSDVLDVVAGLDADEERVQAARAAGVLAGLRRHDWVYRWQQVLATVGVEGGDALRARISQLEARAAELESQAGTASR